MTSFFVNRFFALLIDVARFMSSFLLCHQGIEMVI